MTIRDSINDEPSIVAYYESLDQPRPVFREQTDTRIERWLKLLNTRFLVFEVEADLTLYIPKDDRRRLHITAQSWKGASYLLPENDAGYTRAQYERQDYSPTVHYFAIASVTLISPATIFAFAPSTCLSTSSGIMPLLCSSIA